MLSSHSIVRLPLLQLSGQDLIRRQKSHSDVEEDLPGVPQPMQVHIAQADEGQHQHHLQSPCWTVEQVQVTLDHAGHRRNKEGQDVSNFFLGNL